MTEEQLNELLRKLMLEEITVLLNAHRPEIIEKVRQKLLAMAAKEESATDAGVPSESELP